MVKNLRRRKIAIIVASIIGLIIIGIAFSICLVLYNNSVTLGKFKAQCSELGVGIHNIEYSGVATTLECDADGNLYLPARQFIKAN